MQLDIIGYRYTSEELSVLMSLQGRDSIPAVPDIRKPDREQFSRGLEALEEDDILSAFGGKLLLDKVHAFLMENLCECDRYFTLSAEKAFLALCACRRIAMTVQTRDGEHWVFRVAPDPEGILETFGREAERFPENCTIRLRDGEKEEASVAADRETLNRKSREAVEILKKPFTSKNGHSVRFD